MLEPNSSPWNCIISSFCRDGKHIEALSLFTSNIQSSPSFRQNYQLLATILKSCAIVSATTLGKALHSYAIKIGHFSCHSVSKAILNVYSKSGVVDDCMKLFGLMGNDDPVLWNILLSGFARSRAYDARVMNFFHNMQVSNQVNPNSVSVAIVLPVLARLGDLTSGKSVHGYVIKSGLYTHTLVGNALISLYAKCGLVANDGYAAFSNIEKKDVVSWNAIISGSSENKLMDDVIRLFRWMLKGPIKPNCATIVNILPICGSLDKNVGYFFGREIHCYVLRQKELGVDVLVYNALMSFYMKMGQMKEAEILFQRMEFRDSVSWNAIIAGYAANEEFLKTLDCFYEFISIEVLKPDSVTLVSILPVCAQLQKLDIGKGIHGYILRHPYLGEDTSVGNALVNFYSKCNDIKAAYSSFLMISDKDLISWNSILDAFSVRGTYPWFLRILHGMHREGIRPDHITILSAIRLCTSVSRLDKVKEIHGYSIKNHLLLGDAEPTIGNALLDAYAKCSDMGYAYKLFHSLSDKRNLVSFNSMISGYVNCGSHDEAYMIFNTMSLVDLTTWNLMIRVYAENNFPDKALSLFLDLQSQGLKPDAMTIMSLLPVCSQMASISLLKQCHGYIIRAVFNDVHLVGTLLDTYAKCGNLSSACRIFESSHEIDLVMFTAMVGGYAMHGKGKEAIAVFYHMLELGIKPDNVVITAVLSACSHSGLLDEGMEIFYTMEKVHGIQPTLEQYACLVDLLARGGRIHDAYSLIMKMPLGANANIWGTLLGACKTHHEVELGRIVADRLFEIESDNIGNYVVMSNLYAAEAKWDRVMEMRKLMKTRDLKKPAGCSWIEVENRKNVFVSGDYSHPRREMIYNVLGILDRQIKDPSKFL